MTSQSAGTTSPGSTGQNPGRTHKETIQDTIISVIIAFALAFVFRGFVVEAFVIPTGSMAPTLMGAHERFRNKDTGYTWQVGPWDANPMFSQNYLEIQGTRHPIRVHDPMSGQLVERNRVPLLSGDRILVLKYLYNVFEPERFDVVVFKFKEAYKSEVNYIKRLTGLPGEEIALVDGDVFFRKHMGNGSTAAPIGSGVNRWAEERWQIARKPAHVQEAMWQKLFDSDFAPRNPVTTGRVRTTPWRSEDSGWTIGGRVYEYAGTTPTDLFWDSSILRFQDGIAGEDPWEIDDRYAYDEVPMPNLPPGMYPRESRYPVSDLRMGAGIQPGSAGLKARATIAARSHEFQMEVTENGVTLSMRPAPVPGTTGQAWQQVAQATMPVLGAGKVTNVAFCQIDQTLEAWVEGNRVCSFEYNWSPAERVRFAMGKSVEELLAGERSGQHNAFSSTQGYIRPRIWWSFEGGPVKLHRLSVDRDIYYQPSLAGSRGHGTPGRGTRPEAPMVLNDDQFFVCGDNSPQSLDARLWDPPEPFVREIDPTDGVVTRKMMIGKAFFVYFPATHEESTFWLLPDFGRMRFIW